jgi:hypothetical protein
MADAKQKNQIYALAALLLVAAAVWYYQFAKHPVATGFSAENGTYTPINAQDFGRIIDGLRKAQSTEYKPTGRNIFVAGAVPVVADPTVAVAAKPVKRGFQNKGPVPPPPVIVPPPTMSAIFFGYGQLPSGGPRRAFLLEGEEVRIVGEGETVQNTLRILHIGNDSIEFEDINTHLRGSKQIEATPGAPSA